jgi:alpha-aminoadipate/glutamate carrier protein LysW
MATCPECDAEIEVDEFDVDKGDQLSCPECGSNLEVVSLSPIELDLAPDDDEDEDDDDDEDVDAPKLHATPLILQLVGSRRAPVNAAT